MSFTDDFLKELEKKKKKIDNSVVVSPYSSETGKETKKAKQTSRDSSGDSFTDSFLSELGSLAEKNGTKYKNPMYEEEEEEDIAPVRSDKEGGRSGSFAKDDSEEEKSEKRTWFKKSGAFENGYQFGDVFKTIGGTYYDMKRSLQAGLLGIAEGTIDTGATLIGGVGKLLGADKFADTMSGFVEKDIINEKKVAEKILQVTESMPWDGKGVDSYSVFGDKTDSLIESGGQLGGQIMLQALGVPWFVTSGTTSFGKGAEEAFKEDASYGEAVGSAAISAGAEILTEKLFGGSGLGEKGLINVDLFTSKVANKTVKALMDYGIDVVGEGAEEVVSSIFSRLGTKLYKEENIEELLLSEEAFDEYLESFIGGSVLGGGMNVGKVGSSIKSGRDYRSGLTSDEEAVVNKEVEKRIAEQEKDGKKLTNKEKNKITEAVQEDLDKGYISIDTIEEVLGGDSLKYYQDSLAQEEDLKKQKELADEEFTKLNRMKKGDMTGEQSDRLEELRAKRTELDAQINDANKASERDFLRKKYMYEAYEVARGSRLEESYREIARKKQKFQTDASQYEGLAKESVQNIIDKGQMDNTNRSHDVVDFIVKVASPRGLKVTTTTTAEMLAKAEQKHGRDYVIKNFLATDKNGNPISYIDENGTKQWKLKTIPNAEIEGDTIALNADSPNLSRAIVGHEIFHSFEGTKYYEDLANLLNSYAKEVKGAKEYQAQKKATAKRYKNVAGASAKAELNADLLGEYIFSDEGFIKHLTQNRNVAQRVYDRIKYMIKYATAGSQQERDLLRIKNTFEKAWRDAEKVKKTTPKMNGNSVNGDTATETDVQYSLREADPPKKTQKVYKLMRLVEGGNLAPLFIDSADTLEVGKWYDADSPNMDFLKDMPSGIFLVDAESGTYQTFDEYLAESGEKKTKYPSKNAINQATADGKRWVYIEDTAKGQKRFGGETRKYWNLGINGSGTVSTFSMRPGYHAGSLPTMRQIGKGKNRDLRDDTFVWTEGEVPADIEYQTEADQNPDKDIPTHIPTDGYYLKATNADKAKSQADRVGWYVAGSYKINRIISDSEARQVIDDWNKAHPDQPVEYDYDRESGMDFDAEQMKLVPRADAKYSLSEAQQEYFKDSAVRDDNGNLKVMYHGTSKGGHTVFDTYGSNYGLFGAGSYFTDNKDIAESYTKKGRGKSPKVYEAYLNITSPIDMDAEANPSEWQNAFPDAMFPESGTNEDFYRAMEDYFEDEGYYKYEASEMAVEALEGMGYDGITHIGGGRRNGTNSTSHQVYIAFHPEQIKNIDNAKPTSDADIRYSLSTDSDGKQLSKQQQEYFKDSKMRDDNGNLKVMYHGTQNGGFHVFDPDYSDDGRSLFFVDSNDVAMSYSGTSETYAPKAFKTASEINSFFAEIGKSEYEVVEKDGSYTLYDDGDEVATSDNLSEIFEEFKDWEGVGYGDVNYKVYLNLTNPLEVDAKGGNWNEIEFEPLDNGFTASGRIMWSPKKFDTREIAKYAKENGYDGVIFKNIVDVGGYGGSYKPATVAIAFESEQIKSVANDAPTSNPDIRFSLSKAVEETPDLIAAHNLTSDKLLKSLELGGLPMPSIAITKADSVHNEYGDISLILRKDAIDPKANRENKIYSGDAWTPVYPTIEFKPNDKVVKKIGEKYYDLAHKYGYDDVRPMYRFVNDAEDALKRDKGEQGMLNDLYENTGMMQVYLLDSGKGKVDTIQKEVRSELSDAEVEMNEYFIKELGADIVDDVMSKGDESPMKHRVKYWETYGEKIKEVYTKFLSEEYGFSQEEIDNVLFGMKTYDYLRFVRDAHLYRKNGRVTTRIEADNSATEEAIRQKAAEGYKEWIDGLFKGIEEKTGIRNNRDYFTPSGNRRSWDALHWENTLENVVRVMKEQGNGENTFFTGHGIWGAAANEYKSIEEVKADSDRLKHLPKEEYEQIRGNIGTRLQDVAQRIMNKSERNQFIAADNALACIVDAVRHSRTEAGIYKELKQYSQLNVTEADANEIVSIVADIAKMPTEYFESKPRRAVGFDEVGVFVIPNNADAKLKQELLNRGYSIAEYDPDVEGSRQKVVNSFEQYKFSLSDANAEIAPTADDVPFNSLRYEGLEETAYDPYGTDIAPVESTEKVQNNVQTPTENVQNVSIDDLAPMVDEKAGLEAQLERVNEELETYREECERLAVQVSQQTISYDDYHARIEEIKPRYSELLQENDRLLDEIIALEKAETERQREAFASLTDEDAPPEMVAPHNESLDFTPDDPFSNRDFKAVGNRKVKAYMYENPEVKPFFQSAANSMLGDLLNSTKGERVYHAERFETSIGGEGLWDGVKRNTTDDIAYLLDECHYTYAEIQKGLEAIIEDNGAENNAVSKRIEFLLNDRLLNGYADVDGYPIPPDQNYINLLNEKQITEYNEEARKSFFENADAYDPLMGEIAPVAENVPSVEKTEKKAAPMEYEAITPKPKTKKTASKNKMVRADSAVDQKIAQVLDEEPTVKNRKSRAWAKFKANVLDKGAVFEDLSLKTKNRELMGKWNFILSSEARAQQLMGNGNENVKSLNAIREEVDNTGKTKEFYEYLYHKHNIDRMSLVKNANVEADEILKSMPGITEEDIEALANKRVTKKTPEDTAKLINKAKEYIRLREVQNKPVFGDTVTADVSREFVGQMEKTNPEFKEYAQDVYDYTNYLRKLLVDNGVISQETADLWSQMYPNYVPVRRDKNTGLSINVPLDTGKTGVNAPIKGATGGNSDILPLFDTLAQRTIQTYKAIAKNNFGVELKNTLGTTISNEATSVDEVIESVDSHEELLKKGENGSNPTFTVFENGEKVTYEITEDMYDALKPVSEGLAYTNKFAHGLSNLHRGLLTEYNPTFMLTNAIKDVQDILMNSQHATKTYLKLPEAYAQMIKKGYWYKEYVANGGEQNTYFDKETNTFEKEKKGLVKLVGMPLNAISYANNFIEMSPRLAEYIASRESGRSVEVSMLDAARVTTNFAAGGDITKFLNRNGATFLNASVQGAMQQVRNVREAKANGLKGWANLATKVTLAGLPAMLLNGLLWDDDEDYEELSDYVKQNYYIVAKYGDGKFVRIPKGRMLAVVQNAFEQVGNAITGDDEVDLKSFLDLVVNNIAPNNPIENNILAPIIQVANNETWYGEDLVPTRLQDLPADEQFDESTDDISKWLGEKLNYSPYKINYLLNQYTGGLGDVVLPMYTPEAESGDNSLKGNLLAPLKSKFTTDSTMNNQNVTDFYDTMDKLTTNAKSSRATDEDVLKYKYLNSINSDLSELYEKKREIQNSDLPDDAKFQYVRLIQEEIVDTMKNSLNSYNNVNISGIYATVGDTHYRWYEPGEDSEVEPGWQKLTDKQLAKQNKVTEGLGVSAEEYWSNKEEYDYAYEHPGNYAIASVVGGYGAYRTYSKELYDIKADKDEDGKSISGSRKEKVIDYINNLDADYGEKLILFKTEYPSDDTYNEEIVEYLNSREDISYSDMVTILKELGFTVDGDQVYWD